MLYYQVPEIGRKKAYKENEAAPPKVHREILVLKISIFLPYSLNVKNVFKGHFCDENTLLMVDGIVSQLNKFSS